MDGMPERRRRRRKKDLMCPQWGMANLACISRRESGTSRRDGEKGRPRRFAQAFLRGNQVFPRAPGGKRSAWAKDTDPGSRPGPRLTEETTLPSLGVPWSPPAPTPAGPWVLLLLRDRKAGPFAVRPPWAPGGRFRWPLSAGVPTGSALLWRKLMFSGNSRAERSVAGRDDSGDSGFQQPREAAAGPLLPAFRECGPAPSRPSRASGPRPPDPEAPTAPADRLGLP